MPRRSSVASIIEVSWSSIQIRPLVGSIIRLIILSDVVFPHPEGPTSTVIWPAGASKDSPSTALVPSGKCFETASNRIMPANLSGQQQNQRQIRQGPQCGGGAFGLSGTGASNVFTMKLETRSCHGLAGNIME